MRDRHLLSGPVVAVDGRSSREWMQAADIVVGQHRSRRSARRWASEIRYRYPGCTLAVSCHRSGRWWLVGDPEERITVATVHSSHVSRVPSVEELGLVAFQTWVLWQICRRTNRRDEQGVRS